MLNPYSPAHLLGAGFYHEDHQVCQIHRAWHWSPAATLLHHGAAGGAVRTPAGCGDQRHPGQGERSCVSFGWPPSVSLKRKCDSVIIEAAHGEICCIQLCSVFVFLLYTHVKKVLSVLVDVMVVNTHSVVYKSTNTSCHISQYNVDNPI